MAKDLRTFLDDCRREIPNEVIHVTKEVDPAHYDVTAIIKHLGAHKNRHVRDRRHAPRYWRAASRRTA